MIIDLHSHLLPGVDDGAQNEADTLALAREAVQEGVEHSVITPHHLNGQYVNPAASVVEKTEQLQALYDAHGIALKVYPGQEIRLTEAFLDELYSGNLLSLDGGGLYYLVEMPTLTVPDFAYETLSVLVEQGSIPIIAHPERNKVFMSDLNYYQEFIELGCLGQLTTSSYIGNFGEEFRAVSKQMIERNLVHIFSSDAHSVEWRSFHIQAAYRLMEEEYGSEQVDIYKQRSRAIINGQTFAKPEVIAAPRRKKWSFNFFRK